MQTILITGSNGLLGQKLVAVCVNGGHKVVATSTGKNRITKTKSFVYRKLDITDNNEVNAVIKEFQPDVVINTAAMTNVDACESDKIGCANLNVNAVKNLTVACERFDCHLIHLSTDFVFDGKSGPYDENDVPNPLSYYGNSKYLSEIVVKESDLSNWSIVRTIILYGTAEKMSRSNLVLWARNVLKKHEPIRVVTDQFRAPTLAEDLALACIRIAETGAQGIYHISGPESNSIFNLVNEIADVYELDNSCIVPINTSELNQTAPRPPITGFILDKAKKTLGYAPHTFTEGLKLVEKQLEQN